jgi:hypothetical protein
MATRPEQFVPLPPSVDREEIQLRRIEMRGYRRADGLYDIEGHLTDQKPHVFKLVKGPTRQANEPIHEMWIRLVIDEDFLVHDAIAVSDAAPYRACMAAGFNLQRMKGVSIASGWSREIRARLGGVNGCTHITEMLIPLGSAAFQALVVARREKGVLQVDENGKPRLINSCFAYGQDQEVVARRWPEHFTGDPAVLESVRMNPDAPA